VTDSATGWAHTDQRMSVQPGAPHPVAQQGNLDGERRAHLTDVMDSRKPPRKTSHPASPAGDIRRNTVDDLAREPLVNQQLRYASRVVEMLAQGKPVHDRVNPIAN
jgi:hypothetical protein